MESKSFIKFATRRADIFWGKLLVMTEKRVFDSNFHKWYVGGEGEVNLGSEPFKSKNEIKGQIYDELLAEYRMYMNDPKAEFTEEMLEELAKLGKI